MAQRLLSIPQVGEVMLTKRRGTTRMRLSISASGRIKVNMPYWTPYEAGILFIKTQRPWILQQLSKHAPRELNRDSRVGRKHRISFVPVASPAKIIKTRVTSEVIVVKTSLPFDSNEVRKKTLAACERALKHEAEELLPDRVAAISTQRSLPYRNLRIRKLTSRWGSCSNQKDISLSYYLVQLPWELIDYVVLHELAHTRYHHHGRDFWSFMEQYLPDVRALRRQIRQYKPRIEPH